MLDVRSPRPDERGRVDELLAEWWGSTTIVRRGRAHDASRLPALVALDGDEIVGVATWRVEGGECELVTLNARAGGRGVGSSLLAAVAAAATGRGCRRLWLITTNDNLAALRFYQRRGMRLVALHVGAVDAARERKPSIPVIGEHGIAIHDELELSLAIPRG